MYNLNDIRYNADTMAHQESITTTEYAYTAVFEPAEEGGYVVTFPAIPNLVTEGDNLEEARAMAFDCIQGYLETLQELGRPIPESEAHTPATIRDIMRVQLKTA